MSTLTSRHRLQIALAILVSLGSSAGAVALGDWVSQASEPIAVRCGAELPYRVGYRLQGCAVAVEDVAYSQERGRALAAFLPLDDATTGEPSGIVLRTTDRRLLDWATGAEPTDDVRAYLASTTFRAGRSALTTRDREVPWDMRRVVGLSGRRVEVLDAGDTATDWWLLVAALGALACASLGAVLVVIRTAREEQRRREHRERWRAAFDDAMRDGRRSLDLGDPRAALDDFRRAFDAARELEVANGPSTVQALLGAARARAQDGLADEARDTLTRALGYLEAFRPRDEEIRALSREANDALAALDSRSGSSARN